MQNTRLTTLVRDTLTRFTSFTANPWRRISLIIIGFLLGNFLGNIIITTTGQMAMWDAVAAFFLLISTEIVNYYIYRPRTFKPNSSATAGIILPEIINSLKIGITYSLFIEAFKLGS